MKKYSHALLAAGVSLAMAFTLFACSSDSPNDQGENPNGNNTGSGNFCGRSDYDPETQFCHFETLYWKCGGKGYDPAIQFCEAETIYSKCGDSKYYPPLEFCNEGTTYDKCGGKEFVPSLQFCDDRAVYSKCGGEKFIPSLQFCYNSTVYFKCNGNEWNPATQICYSRGNGTVGIYKTVTIGTQTWMAENLSYFAPASVCYDGNTANCDKYGRLYNWAAAMDLAFTCNSNTCASQVSAKHRGICPEGWHIPSRNEWNTLVDFVGVNPETKLKAKQPDWNGTDIYGFSALPGGAATDGTSVYVGTHGFWWTSTEGTVTSAYIRRLHSSDAGVGELNVIKTEMGSVRCIKD